LADPAGHLAHAFVQAASDGVQLRTCRSMTRSAATLDHHDRAPGGSCRPELSDIAGDLLDEARRRGAETKRGTCQRASRAVVAGRRGRPDSRLRARFARLDVCGASRGEDYACGHLKPSPRRTATGELTAIYRDRLPARHRAALPGSALRVTASSRHLNGIARGRHRPQNFFCFFYTMLAMARSSARRKLAAATWRRRVDNLPEGRVSPPERAPTANLLLGIERTAAVVANPSRVDRRAHPSRPIRLAIRATVGARRLAERMRRSAIAATVYGARWVAGMGGGGDRPRPSGERRDGRTRGHTPTRG